MNMNVRNKFRKLTKAEISILQNQGCSSDGWEKINVGINFTPECIFNTHFSGNIQLGSFEYEFVLDGGVIKHSGLSNVTLQNCTIGNDVLIENIANYIANYEIGERSFIQNANLIVTDGYSAFGNGTLVSVLNETGGRGPANTAQASPFSHWQLLKKKNHGQRKDVLNDKLDL